MKTQKLTSIKGFLINLFSHNARCYSIQGVMVFEFIHPNTWHDGWKIADTIFETNRKDPWVDENFKSILFIDPGEVKVDQATSQKSYSVGIHPEMPFIRKGQINAYEQYLVRLAEELAKRNLKGVARVRSELRKSLCLQ